MLAPIGPSSGSPARSRKGGERSRHRRLVHAQADGDPRYAAFNKHGVQDPYEMEVYLVKRLGLS